MDAPGNSRRRVRDSQPALSEDEQEVPEITRNLATPSYLDNITRSYADSPRQANFSSGVFGGRAGNMSNLYTNRGGKQPIRLLSDSDSSGSPPDPPEVSRRGPSAPPERSTRSDNRPTHRDWTPKFSKIIKCDFCNERCRGTSYCCARCYVLICKACAINGVLKEDGVHNLDHTELDWDLMGTTMLGSKTIIRAGAQPRRDHSTSFAQDTRPSATYYNGSVSSPIDLTAQERELSIPRPKRQDSDELSDPSDILEDPYRPSSSLTDTRKPPPSSGSATRHVQYTAAAARPIRKAAAKALDLLDTQTRRATGGIGSINKVEADDDQGYERPGQGGSATRRRTQVVQTPRRSPRKVQQTPANTFPVLSTQEPITRSRQQLEDKYKGPFSSLVREIQVRRLYDGIFGRPPYKPTPLVIPELPGIASFNNPNRKDLGHQEVAAPPDYGRQQQQQPQQYYPRVTQPYVPTLRTTPRWHPHNELSAEEVRLAHDDEYLADKIREAWAGNATVLRVRNRGDTKPIPSCLKIEDDSDDDKDDDYDGGPKDYAALKLLWEVALVRMAKVGLSHSPRTSGLFETEVKRLLPKGSTPDSMEREQNQEEGLEKVQSHIPRQETIIRRRKNKRYHQKAGYGKDEYEEKYEGIDDDYDGDYRP